MPELHSRKRIDVFVEMAVLPRVEDALNAGGASGYTVVPCIKGRGWQGEWRSDEIADVGMVMVSTILRAEKLDAVLERLRPVLERWRIVVSVSDVSVLRSDKF